MTTYTKSITLIARYFKQQVETVDVKTSIIIDVKASEAFLLFVRYRREKGAHIGRSLVTNVTPIVNAEEADDVRGSEDDGS